MEPRTVDVKYVDGTGETLTCEVITVARFRLALAASNDGMDEMRVVEFCYNKPQGWCDKLTPESYTAAADAAYGANPDFFGLVARRAALKSLRG